MMDAWAPAARAVTESERAQLPPTDRLRRAEAAAMIAATGRAARLGARSLGHVDPGAASAVIVIGALSEWLQACSAASGEGRA